MESAEDIVISGIAGKFPECENVEEFKEALLQGIDLTTEDDRRYPAGSTYVMKGLEDRMRICYWGRPTMINHDQLRIF
ncbi:hypothetical protein JTB14_031493 [Gonioctena quinquepunctata]|nr:hypothetical protein JTB14_031493 [Gonioctena quinquepunctata]